MINNILIDLGNTIINNIKLDLEKGLEYLYNISKCEKISKNDFIKIGLELMDKTFKEKIITDIEKPFTKYLEELENKTEVTYPKEYSNLELEIYRICAVDSFNDDAYNFLLFCKKNNLNVYCYSNSTFSKDALMETLKDFKIDHLIDELYSSSDIIYRKPSKLFFEKTDVFKNVKKEECIMVGNDYLVDGGFSKNIGIRFAWYNIKNDIDKDKIASISFSSYKDLEEYILNYGK